MQERLVDLRDEQADAVSPDGTLGDCIRQVSACIASALAQVRADVAAPVQTRDTVAIDTSAFNATSLIVMPLYQHAQHAAVHCRSIEPTTAQEARQAARKLAPPGRFDEPARRAHFANIPSSRGNVRVQPEEVVRS